LNLYPPNIFNVDGQVNVVVASPRYRGDAWKDGVLIGIEMKTHITDQSFIKAQAECLMLSDNSSMPVIQLLTDMESGGVVYYVVTDSDGRRIESRVLRTLEGLWAFATGFLASLEREVITGSAHQCRESNATELLGGHKFRRYSLHTGAAAGPAQVTDTVLRFLSNFEEDGNDLDSDQPAEDFNDDLYSLPPGAAAIPERSDFS